MKYFQSIKSNAIREFCSKQRNSMDANFLVDKMTEYLSSGSIFSVRSMKSKIEDQCVEMIERTDIRNFNPLMELCPDSFPSWVKSGNYGIDMDDKGWYFFKK